VTPRRAAWAAGFHVGTAGWTLPKEFQPAFPAEGTHLERYGARLPAAEINSSFYRPHRPATYERWAASVPETFRFAVKIPRTITHERRLVDAAERLDLFLSQAGALGARLGCLLVQLPPSFEHDRALAGAFLSMFRALHDGPIAIEPRHATWFTCDAARVLEEYGVSRVAADPARVPEAAVPGGDPSLAYFRLHGSPRIYWSRYEPAFITDVAAQLRAALGSARAAWCIFDNTASGSAIPNALELSTELERGGDEERPEQRRDREGHRGVHPHA